MKKFFYLFCSFMFAVFLLFPNSIKAAEENKPSRQINLVYDDSGSMYYDFKEEHDVDTWAQAKYAMEVFASMLGEKDTLFIYYMSDYANDTNAGPRIKLYGSNDSAANVSEVHNQKTADNGTPFNSVKKAYDDLTGNSADERWLVVLTDGELQGTGKEEDEGNYEKIKENLETFFNQKDPNINVMYMGMGPSAIGINGNENNKIYYSFAKDSKDILHELTGISTRIFNSNKLDIDNERKTFSFDVPMNELIVFAQGSDVNINGIRKTDGSFDAKATNTVEVKYSDCDNNLRKNQPVTDLKGKIAYFNSDFSEGDYELDITGAETIEIYYKPNVDIAAYITDSQGNEVTDMSDLEAGEYNISFGFVKAGTKEKVGNSKLLGNITYEAFVKNNGKEHDRSYSDGDKISLESGTLEIDANAYYLDYNRVSTHLDYTIYKDREVTFSVLNNPSYNVSSSGIEGEEYIEVEAKLDGNAITPEEWNQMDVPAANIKSGSGLGAPKVEKSEKVGVYKIFPTLKGNKPAGNTYSDSNYELVYDQKVGLEAWGGKMEDTIKFGDSRSWFEKNRDWIIRLAIIGGIAAWLIGYLPFIKNYLPKTLKKRPYVKAVPKMPGSGRKDRHGQYDKNVISTIIPYKSQTGIIKFVPKGVRAPSMAVKAIRNNRMSLTNIKAFAGKEDITFDGESIKKDTKKFETGANVTIKYEYKEWTYTCNLDQDNK